MPFQLSPGVAVVEKDFSSIVPAVSSSVGAFAGVFQWGPVMDPITITSEDVLVQRFGRPVDANAQSFFTAANFLSYSNNLLVVRVDTDNARNAVAIQSGSVSAVTVSTGGDSYLTPPSVTFSAPQIEGGQTATGVAVLTGDSVTAINITNPGSGYTAAPTVTIEPKEDGLAAAATAAIVVGGVKINNAEFYTNFNENGAGAVGAWAAKFPGALGNSLTVSMADSASYATWTYRAEFDAAPGTSSAALAAGGEDDEVHVVIIDSDGAWTGSAGSLIEKFAFLSKASDNLKSDGSNNYYKNVINSTSRYVWWMDHVEDGDNWGSNSSTEFDTLSSPSTINLSGGVDDLTATDGQLMNGYSLFANDELYDVSLIAAGKASEIVAEHIINNVVETRKDCVAFISPQYIVNNTTNGIDRDIIKGGTLSEMVEAVNEYRNELPSTSYAVLDSGYKYQYDRYNDTYRWIPLNGDIAGLCARTDYTNDPWWSPGGYNRGQIKNVVKLAVNPGKTERDNLYKNGVNPVVNFPGQGVVLFGDKTLQAKPSAFDRINVRRLFIVLEKAIATAAKYQLFEFNDDFTRAQFKNLVEPFLRDVQGRRGIIDFRVKCDDTNNTGEVIDRNEFVADIFIKPARSINFITLTFVAARTSVNFSEIGA
jgi:phage tail sheath protein FI